ncbi:transposable element Tcb2 transposase [Trichonephila clavipes]|nr:transposable element Tcb2 transposase [Trichonephila clavipes]
MSSRHHIDDFIVAELLERSKKGENNRCCQEFDIAHSVVSRLWKPLKTTGMCSRRHGGGRVRSTTPAEDRYIVLSAKRNRCTTAQQLAKSVSCFLRKADLPKNCCQTFEGRRTIRTQTCCACVTRQHRTACLQWCREHYNWTEQDWASYYSQMRVSVGHRIVDAN